MNVQELTREQLNAFHARQRHAQFTQSWEWGNLLEHEGKHVQRLGVMDGDRVVAVATVSTQSLPMKQALLRSARGPLFDPALSAEQRVRVLDVFTNALDQNKQRGVIAWRVEPLIRDVTIGRRTIAENPKRTLILDLEPDEEMLLKQMRQKTRYNVKLAERKGVVVERRTDREAVDVFWKLLKQTTRRDKFRPHPKSHYESAIEILGKNTPGDRVTASAAIDIASVHGSPVAANLVMSFGDTATYVHGASGNSHREMMAPHLLQWHAIAQAKQLGYRYYDFHGIAETEHKKHPWAGITRFKKGFGGEVVDYPGTFDVILNHSWYLLYMIARQLTRSFGR